VVCNKCNKKIAITVKMIGGGIKKYIIYHQPAIYRWRTGCERDANEIDR